MSGFKMFLYVLFFSGVNTDDSSDNEPLIKIAKNASKGVKVFSVSPKKPTDTKKEGNFLSMHLQHEKNVPIFCSG